jgi:DNA-binding transcriptional LysR family regulator
MDQLSTLSLFIATADTLSFTRAAQIVGCSPTAASRAIAWLEASLGTALLRRSTRQVALTEAGAAYRDRIRPLLEELRDAGASAASTAAEPNGALHITTPTVFGRLHVLPVLGGLLARHPGLSARMLLIDRNVRLIEEGIDVAVRIGPLADSTLTATRISEVRPAIVASPAYLARHNAPRTVADLATHDLIVTTGPRQATQWTFNRKSVANHPRLAVTTVEAAVAAAEAGIGLASLLSYQVSASLAGGSLVEVLADLKRPALPVSLVFDGRRTASPARALFTAAMKSATPRSL